ncbi:MAG: hypothetical protein U0T82_00635 [Bacteroidales bacterium]
MNQPIIEFKKEREFGDVLNATFAFIGQEFKPLGKALLYYAVPVILLAGIAMGFFQSKALPYQMGNAATTNPFGYIIEFLGLYLLVIIMTILSQTMVMTILYGYIKLYNERGKDNFTFEDVKAEIGKNFARILGATLLTGLIVIIGSILCIIPGIYMGVSLSLISAAIVFEGKTVGEGFSRSFDLTKLAWWWTFLLIFLVFLIVGVLGSIVQIPMTVIGVTSALMEATKNGGEIPDSLKTFMIVYSSISTVISTLLYTIAYTAIAFQFYNLVEKKEKPSLEAKINQIE